jgi:hypothetical protein
MTVSIRALFFPALVCAILAACGSSEPAQRHAFGEFLQTRVVDVSGIRVPELTDKEKEAFGVYADDYTIISNFHVGMNERVTEPNNDLMKKTVIRSIGDIIEQRDEIAAAKAEMANLQQALDDEQAKADAARAQLKQPADLKPRYDQAYEKLVTAPANAYRDVFPTIDGVFGSSLKIADYVKAHRNQIEVSGTVVRVADPSVQKTLGKLLDDLNAEGEKVAQAQRKMQEVVLGG